MAPRRTPARRARTGDSPRIGKSGPTTRIDHVAVGTAWRTRQQHVCARAAAPAQSAGVASSESNEVSSGSRPRATDAPGATFRTAMDSPKNAARLRGLHACKHQREQQPKARRWGR